MPALSIRDLDIRFPGLDAPALAIPALDLEAGARVALTGASGSGKTTFINAVSGLERVRQGAVRWGDTDLATLGEARRDRWRAASIGLVMQDFHLFPGLTVLDNVLLPHRLSRALPLAEARAEGERLLTRFGIARHAQRVETLSGGQRQAVAVARAAAFGTKVVILDEPTASLGVRESEQVVDLIRELRNQRMPVILVSHNMPQVFEVADRIQIQRLGRLAGVVSPETTTMEEAVAIMTGAKTHKEQRA